MKNKAQRKIVFHNIDSSSLLRVKTSFPKEKKKICLGLKRLGKSMSTDNVKVTLIETSSGIVKCTEKPNDSKTSRCLKTSKLISTNFPVDLSQKSNVGKVKPRHRPRHRRRKRCTQQTLRKGNKDNGLSLDKKPVIVKMPSTSVENLFQVQVHVPIKNNNSVSSIEDLLSTGFEITASSDDGHDQLSVHTEYSTLDNLSSKLQETLNPHLLSSTKPKEPIPESKIKQNECLHFDRSQVCFLDVNCTDKKNTTAKFYQLSLSEYLVVMKPESDLYIIGVLEIELIKGCIEVFGYSLNKQSQSVLIFSLQGSSHLFLKAKCSSNNSLQNMKKVTLDKLISLGLPEKTANNVLKDSESSTIFIIGRNKTHVSWTVWPQFLKKHMTMSIFPPTNLLNRENRPCHSIERSLGCLLEGDLQKCGFKQFKEIPEWSTVVEEITFKDLSKVIVYGGKSVGKSTLLRYLINKSLQKSESVVVIDFDVGQCEFTVPGCISLTLVREAVLGPNYSHLQEPIRSVFLGEVDVTKCPENYIEGCKSLIMYGKQHFSNVTWLINTMGFVRGFGVTVACGIIKAVSPTHVVQIEDKDRKLNFPSLLEPAYVYCQDVGAFDTAKNVLDYELYTIPSASEQQGFIQKSRNLSPAESRNLVILSYLSGMLSYKIASLSQVIPHVINMELVELLTTDKYDLTKAQVAAAMNGNLVALCHLTQDNTFPNCRGFGIVRAIDWQTGSMFVITPVPQHTLNTVNCLVKGNVALPESLYYNQGEFVSGHVPYLAVTSGGSTARYAKRDFRTLPV